MPPHTNPTRQRGFPRAGPLAGASGWYGRCAASVNSSSVARVIIPAIGAKSNNYSVRHWQFSHVWASRSLRIGFEISSDRGLAGVFLAVAYNNRTE